MKSFRHSQHLPSGSQSLLRRLLLRACRSVAVAVLLAAAISSPAVGQTIYSWNATTTGSFSNAANWTNGTAPTAASAADTLSFFSGIESSSATTVAATNNIASGTFGQIATGTNPNWSGTPQLNITGSSFTLTGVSGTGISMSSKANLAIKTSMMIVGNSQTWSTGTVSGRNLNVDNLNLGAYTVTIVGAARDVALFNGGTGIVSSGGRIVVDQRANTGALFSLFKPMPANSTLELVATGNQNNYWSGTSAANVIVTGSLNSVMSMTVRQSISIPNYLNVFTGTFTGAQTSGTFALLSANADFVTNGFSGSLNGLVTGSFSNLIFGGAGSFGAVRLANSTNDFSTSSMSLRAGTLLLAANDLADGTSTGALGKNTAVLTVGLASTTSVSPEYAVLSDGSRTINRGIAISSTATAIGNSVTIGQWNTGTSTFGGAVSIGRAGLLLSSGSSASSVANFTGPLSGGNGVTVVGNGGVSLSSAASSYSGPTTVRSGVLSVGGDAPSSANGALGNASSAILLGDTTIVSGSTVAAAFNGNATLTGTVANTVALGATLADGDLVLAWRQNTAGQNGIYRYTAVNASQGTLSLVASGSAAGVYGTQYLVTGGTFANQRFWINTSNAATTGFVMGDVANPNVSLLASSAVTIGRPITVVLNSSSGVSTIGGSLTSGTAVFAGTITLNKAVTLQAATGGTVDFTGAWTSNDNGITIGSAGNAGTVRLSSVLSSTGAFSLNAGTLDMNGVSQTVAAFSGAASTTVTSASPATLTASSAADSTFGGALTGAVGLRKQGAGTLTLSASNSFSGDTTVDGGVLSLGDANALRGSTFDASGAGAVSFGSLTAATLGGLKGSGNLSLQNGSSQAVALAVGSNGSSTTYAGTLTGPGSLVKTGAGKVILAGNNSYAGATTVSEGILAVNGDQSAALGAVSVASGATLMGSGTVGGKTTIAGLHSPGNSPGIQTFGGDLTYSGGSSAVLWELVANTISNTPLAYDQIVVGGALDFAGLTALTLSFDSAGSSVDWSNAFWDTGRTWTLYSVTGTTTNFSNLTLTGSPGSWLDTQSTPQSLAAARPDASFSIVQDGNNVNIVYAIVPEPGSLALAGIGIAAAAYYLRFRSPSRKRRDIAGHRDAGM
jgi:fibronectin-binding autotransporter adhesin